MSQRLVWHCRKGKSHKFYILTVERDLWGYSAIVRRWGRIDGTRTGVVVHWHPEASFDEIAKQIHQRRRWHDYQLTEDPNRILS